MRTKKAAGKCRGKIYPAHDQVHLGMSWIFFANSRASMCIIEENLQGIFNIQRKERKSKEREMKREEQTHG